MEVWHRNIMEFPAVVGKNKVFAVVQLGDRQTSGEGWSMEEKFEGLY